MESRKKISHKKKDASKDWVEKISDTLYIHHISKKTEERWKNQRRKRDKLNGFKDSNGFHLKPDGRCGTIYYIEKPNICEFYYEFSGNPKYDILIDFNNKNTWDLPSEKAIGTVKKDNIKKAIELWLKDNNIRAQL